MGKRVLLADDSLTIQKLVEMALSDTSHKLLGVVDGQQAIDQLSDFNPDIVLADAIMPLVDGYQLCQAVKSNPRFRHVPVVLLLGRFQPFDEAAAAQAGIDAKIIKPFLQEQLVRLIDELPSGKPELPEPVLPHGFDENATVQYNREALQNMVLKDAAKDLDASDLPSLDDFDEQPEASAAKLEEPIESFDELDSEVFAADDLPELEPFGDTSDEDSFLPEAESQGEDAFDALPLSEPYDDSSDEEAFLPEAELESDDAFAGLPLSESVASHEDRSDFQDSAYDDETVHVDVSEFGESFGNESAAMDDYGGQWGESQMEPQEFEAIESSDSLPESDSGSGWNSDFGASDLEDAPFAGSDFDQELAEPVADVSSFKDVADELSDEPEPQTFTGAGNKDFSASDFSTSDFGEPDFGESNLGSEDFDPNYQATAFEDDEPAVLPDFASTGSTMELDESDLEDLDSDLDLGDVNIGMDDLDVHDLEGQDLDADDLGDLEDGFDDEAAEIAELTPEVNFDMAEPVLPNEMAENDWDKPTEGMEPLIAPASSQVFDAWNTEPDEAQAFDPDQALGEEDQELNFDEEPTEDDSLELDSQDFDLEEDAHEGFDPFATQATHGEEIALEVETLASIEQPTAASDWGGTTAAAEMDFESPLAIEDELLVDEADEADEEDERNESADNWQAPEQGDQEVAFEEEDEDLLGVEGDELLDLGDEQPEMQAEPVVLPVAPVVERLETAAPQAAAVPPPVAAAAPAPVQTAVSAELNDAQLDRLADKIVSKLIEKLGHDQVREIAWEVIPEIAEAIIKKRIYELEKSADHPN